MNTGPTIKIYTTNDEATIVWKYTANIKNCLGFAVFRKKQGETDLEAEPVHTFVGFAGDPHSQDENRPSTEWPIQKYMWIDYFVSKGDVIAYRVIPMIQQATGKLEKSMAFATPWSPMVTVGNIGGAEAYFNRGLVSSQFLAKRLNNIPVKERVKTLKTNLLDANSAIRSFMGGNLMLALHGLLDEVAKDPSLQLYTALYELDEFELIAKLNKLGKRAHIILANGAFGPGKPDPQAVNAKRLTIKPIRRIVSSGHFAHNKFVVITQKQGATETAVKVLTGSTNWTTNGLFTQVNNAVILHDAAVAAYYKAEWDAIAADCNGQGKGLYAAPYRAHNNAAFQNKKADITTYFAPVPKPIDMDAADKCIRAAKQGVLFLMFKPGTEGKSRILYDTILAMRNNKNLYVNGVMNADPGGKKNPTITFMNNNKEEKGDLSVVLPAAINEDFQFWQKEVSPQNVTIHSKAIVIDPFSDDPVIITGSHNMGIKASHANDDNLNIIRGNKALAQAYAINMMGVYHHYRWRFFRSRSTLNPQWDGNIKNDSWQNWYKTGNKAAELKFWLGM